MNTQQIDALRVFMSPETTDEIQPNFDDVKTVSDDIESVKTVADHISKAIAINNFIEGITFHVNTLDANQTATINMDGFDITLGVPKGPQGQKGDKPVFSVDNSGNLLVSYEDDTDYNTVGVY
jgi:hypothetical protein